MINNDPDVSIGNVVKSLDKEKYYYNREHVNFFLKNERKRWKKLQANIDMVGNRITLEASPAAK
jgi:hypothetical protein